MKVRYGIVAAQKGEEPGTIDVLHFCGYEEKPTMEDFMLLRQELATDPEFELTDIIDELTLQEASPEMVEYYGSIIPEDA